MSNPDDPQTWIAKADSDLLNIHNNLAGARVPWDTVCFHAQQAAEKMLKAYLVSRGQQLSRTHDLVALLAEAVVAGAPLQSLEADCRLLTTYAVLLRYPGPMPDPAERDGRDAVAAAERIYRHVRAAIERMLGT